MQDAPLAPLPSTDRLDRLSALVRQFAEPAATVAHGGRVRTISAGYYTVSGLSRHVRLGDFVTHRSATGDPAGRGGACRAGSGLCLPDPAG
ncbi:MAG: hypothetical protein QM775_25510 [Pirellulales bacterium]